VYAEFLLREEFGERPSLESFHRRFPDHASKLDQQVNLHRIMGPPTCELPPTPDEAPQEVTPNSVLERCWPEVAGYEILDELGRGGMGVVYRARQLGLNRIVALKMVLGGPFANPNFQARFRSEAEVIARMQHPNIVQVFAVGTQESRLGAEFGSPYFSLEYVDGGSLEQSLGGKPRSPRAAAALVETLARAVHYAHDHGIIHRDLKSANILLTGAGVPKISDFGLAKQINGPAGQTINGTIMGTPEYMAPEQAAGGSIIGPPADIYALGVILYELMTGRTPFVGTTLDVLAQVKDREPMSPSLLQSKTPRDLETICLKCLRKDPRSRYACSLALAEDLRHFLNGEPIQARPVSAFERTWRWAVRRPAVAALSALAIALGLGGAVGVTVAWLYALAGWGEADRLRVEAVKKHVEADIRREQAEETLYFNRIAEAHLERRFDNILSAEALLDACVPREGGIDRRGWEWYYLKRLQHADLLTIPSAHEEFVADMAISPDGQQLATAGGTPFFASEEINSVKLWALRGPDAGKCIKTFPQKHFVVRLTYRKGGNSLVWSDVQGMVGVIDLQTGRAGPPADPLPGRKRVWLSPDGLSFAAITDDDEVVVCSVDGCRVLLRIPVSRVGEAAGLAFDPTGSRLAILCASNFEVWDVARGRKVVTLAPLKQPGNRPVFSNDGRILACGMPNGLVRIWDAEKGNLLQSLGGHAGGVMAVAFAPDNRYLASAGADQTVRVWDMAEGLEVSRFRGHQGRASCLAFPASGRYLVSGSEQPGEIKGWDLTRHQEYISVPQTDLSRRTIEGLGFSQSGEVLNAVRNYGVIQVADADSGVESAVVKIDFGGKWVVPSALASLTSDGRLLACTSRANRRIVHILDAQNGRSLLTLSHEAEVLHIAFSRDGKTVATSAHDFKDPKSRREIRVWDVETGNLRRKIDCPPFFSNHIYGALALSAYGGLLAFDECQPAGEKLGEAQARVRVHLMDLSTGEVLRTLEGLPSLVRSFAFSPDGRFLALSCEEGGLFVHDRKTDRWEPSQPLTGSAFDCYMDMSYSPDGTRLAGVGRLQVQLWDAISGSPVLALRGAPPRPKDVGFNPKIAWSPDGRRLAASNWNGTASIWDSADRHTPDVKRALLVAADERGRMP
jgi:WD40 repeat protein